MVNKDIEQQIIADYENNGIEFLCSKYKMGKIRIKKILTDNGIEIRKKGGSKTHMKTEFIINLENKVLTCNSCKKTFNDVENRSGVITNHMKECFPNTTIPTKLFRSNYKKTQGTLWHLQWFTLNEKTVTDTLKCPECDWETKDLINKTGWLTTHVHDKHGSIKEFVSRNPEWDKYFNKYNEKLNRESELQEEGSSVECKLCGEKFKMINEKHLITKHNISLYDYKLKFGSKEYVSKITKDKLIESYNSNLKLYENDYKSKAEVEISDIIRESGLEVLNNNKKIFDGTEIDIVVPEIKICFEYNGLYYHREKMGKDKYFHLNKQLITKEKGYILYHIFEDEWIHEKDKCIMKIKHLLNINNSNKVYARKLTIRRINIELLNEFLNVHHMLGEVNGVSYSIGGFLGNELITVMSFTNIGGVWNLTRSASNINYRVVGGFSKLLTYFIKDKTPTVIITFADRRWSPDSDDNVYIKNGFMLDKTLKPDYTYVNFNVSRNKRIHKFNCRKKILLRKYPDIVDIGMTEKSMTELLGYDKIWDCGLYRYKMIIKQ